MERVVHLRDRFKPNVPDLEWIQELAAEGGWAILSGDAFRKKNGAERRVVRDSGLSVMVLQPSWANYPFWEKTAQGSLVATHRGSGKRRGTSSA
jgi:hypothetical protein